jgi:hypothetical protein
MQDTAAGGERAWSGARLRDQEPRTNARGGPRPRTRPRQREFSVPAAIQALPVRSRPCLARGYRLVRGLSVCNRQRSRAMRRRCHRMEGLLTQIWCSAKEAEVGRNIVPGGRKRDITAGHQSPLRTCPLDHSSHSTKVQGRSHDKVRLFY